MRLVDTEEMKKLWREIELYLLECEEGYCISEDAPEGIEAKHKEYSRLQKEQIEYEMSLLN